MVAYVPPKQAGKYKAVASGAITNGKPVAVNSTGTVTQVSATAGAVGTAVAFESAATNYHSIAFDSNGKKIVKDYKAVSGPGGNNCRFCPFKEDYDLCPKENRKLV